MDFFEQTVRNSPGIALEDIHEDGFAFATLADRQKILYAQLLNGVTSLEESFEVYGAKADDIEPVYHAMLVDHPELFWLDGSTSYSYYSESSPITITPGMSVDASEVEGIRLQIEAAADGYLQAIPEDADDYTIAKMAYDFVINTTDYNIAASQNQNIMSVFLGHESVCAGYARAYQYLLQRAGLTCSFVEGTIPSTGEDHAWNIVCVDGAYTYVDPTWGDPTYPGLDDGAVDIVYDYLGLTTSEILRDDHVFANQEMWPVCDSTSASYYMREGLVFDSVDDPVLSESFWRQQGEGAYPIVFKFSNEEAYVQARSLLEAGEFLYDDIVSLFSAQDRLGTGYQYQLGDALYILKLFL